MKVGKIVLPQPQQQVVVTTHPLRKRTPLNAPVAQIEMLPPILRCALCHDVLYSPGDGVFEHGHRFDFATCPNDGKRWRVPAIPIVAEEIG